MNIESAASMNCAPAPAGEPKITLTDAEAKRFWSKVDKTSSERGCWLWTGSKMRKGYGKIRMRNKSWSAHKFSFTLHNGEVPRGLLVCHECDVRNCINPNHLWLGTNEDNIEDMVRKGRAADGSQVPKGEKCYNAKITEADVHEMRRCYENGEKSQKELAAIYGLQQMQVSRIMNGTRWKHMNLAPIKRTDWKLNAPLVLEIRERYLRGDISTYALGKMYGVTQACISRVLLGKNWISLKLTPIRGIRNNYGNIIKKQPQMELLLK